MSNCGCGGGYSQYQSRSISICDPCNSNTGCAIQLDMECVIYHKSNNQVSNLTNLGLTNGSTLNQFVEAVDPYIGQLKVQNHSLPCLRADYTINNLQQFTQSVDTELCSIKSDLIDLATLINTPITPVNSDSISIVTYGTNNHTISAEVNISATVNNMVAVLGDGLFVPPQTLSINYTTKELSISNGNTVDLTGVICGVGGFLGNLAVDPASPLDGQYWYNTATSELRIRVNGLTKIITIS